MVISLMLRADRDRLMKPELPKRESICPPPIFEYSWDASDMILYQGLREKWWQHSESRLETMQGEIDTWMFSAGVSGHARSICNDQGPSAATVTGHLGHASRTENSLLSLVLAVTRGWSATEELAEISRRRFHRCCAMLRLQ